MFKKIKEKINNFFRRYYGKTLKNDFIKDYNNVKNYLNQVYSSLLPNSPYFFEPAYVFSQKEPKSFFDSETNKLFDICYSKNSLVLKRKNIERII